MQDMYNSTFSVGCRNERCSLFPPKQTTINVPLRMHKKQEHTEYYWSSNPAISKLISTCFFWCFMCFFFVFFVLFWCKWRRCQHWDSIGEWRNLITGEKPIFALGGTQTPDFANSMAVAAKLLLHLDHTFVNNISYCFLLLFKNEKKKLTFDLSSYLHATANKIILIQATPVLNSQLMFKRTYLKVSGRKVSQISIVRVCEKLK